MLYILLFSLVNCHTWMLSPKPRIDDLCIVKFSGNNCCGNQPTDTSNLPTYQRGQSIETTYGRNNHIGGFIRYYILPLKDSDTGDFELFQANCYASGPECFGRGNSIFTGDPPGSDFNSVICTNEVFIPNWLKDGSYTLRWLWSNGGSNYNIMHSGLVDFSSCHDFKIAGGPLNVKPNCPLFIGGDMDDLSKNACEFFKSNEVNGCTTGEDNQDICVGDYGKAPPKEIMNCPTNVRNIQDPSNTRLFVGNSTNPFNNNEYYMNFEEILDQFNDTCASAIID